MSSRFEAELGVDGDGQAVLKAKSRGLGIGWVDGRPIVAEGAVRQGYVAAIVNGAPVVLEITLIVSAREPHPEEELAMQHAMQQLVLEGKIAELN